MDRNLIKKSGIFVAIFVVFILALSAASAQVLSYEVPLSVSYKTPFSYYGDAAQYYFPSFTTQMCESGQDFIIEIPPGACSPAVVRSDLLEEQPVSVFCKLSGIKINPLIEVPNIKRIMLTQKEASKDIITVLFHPARAGLQTSFASLIGSPTMNDLGYLVVVLKQKATEKEMPEMIEANLTARIEYEMEKSFGIAENQILLEILTDDEWKNTYEKYGFWNGKGYVRVKDISKDKAKIEVYDEGLRLLHTFNLEEGEISDPSYMPGFYCSAGYKVKLEEIEYPQVTAELYVNDNKLLVTSGMALQDSGCVVEKIKTADYGLGGSVKIKCPEGSYTLTKEATSKAKLSISGAENIEGIFNVGDNIYDNLKIVYAGKVLKGKEKDKELLNVVVVANVTEKVSEVIKELWKGANDYFKISYWKDKEKWAEAKTDEELAKSLDGYLQEGAYERIKKVLGLNIEKWVIVNSGEKYGIKVEVKEIEGLQRVRYDDIVEEYYEKAIDAYKDVAETYPDLADKSGVAYGAKALWEAAKKAGNLSKTFDQAVILEELIREYPNIGLAAEAREELASLYSTADAGKASKFISSGGKGYSLKLSEIIEPTREEKNVKLSIDGSASKIFTEHDLLLKDEWQISEIKDDGVYFKNFNTSSIIKVNEGEEDLLGKAKVKVVEITLKKFARVSVLPWSNEGVTLTNFTFKVGIEKRAIKLSPEQTKEYITKLDKTISKWENIKDKLGSVVTTWRKVCLIGAGALWLNNVLDTLSGKGIARNMVMRGFGDQPGMMQECAALEASGKYSSISECLRAKEESGELDAQIGAVQNAINNCNTLAKDIKAADGVMVSGGKILGGLFEGPKRIDNKAYLNEFYNDERIKGRLTSSESEAIKSNIEEEAIFRSETKDICTYLELEEMCKESKEEMKTLCDKTTTLWNSQIKGYQEAAESRKNQQEVADALTAFGLDTEFIDSIPIEGEKTPTTKIHTLIPADAEKMGFGKRDDNIKVGKFRIGSEIYLPIVELEAGEWIIKELYSGTITDGKITAVGKVEDLGKWQKEYKIYKIEGKDPQKCMVNKYEGKLEIEFWEEEPYEGMPAKMPLISLKKGTRGLYFATKQYGYGMEAYSSSAKVLNFYICSVGENGIPEWDFGVGARGDDCCELISYGEAYPSKDLPYLGLTKNDVTKVLTCAREAASAYKSGEKRRIATSCCEECAMGKPAVAAPSTTCEDFMSPSSCNLMFNLCDPVVCPASRCDFGGKIPVDDVIQTGIIGGLTLCLPNAKEVAVPICLSGIHAGLENYITILKSARDCLKERLASGKTVGICDQLTSVYICEFFWRQLAPFLKVGVPSLVESLVGGKKSGGEYLTFSDAWKNAQDSAKYILSYYKEDALRAFNIGSLAEAGTPLCRAFVSLRYPNQVDLFDELTKPESPYQLNAIFYETPMTTATVPAMSHYKVYYHIYAGEEKGHYYMVYLKQPPQPGYYETPEMYPVPQAVGYISAGQFVDVAKDFTAPASYMELCVRIDAKDHCGFGKATTSLAVEKLMDSYISEQTATEISTEKECISGTAGMIAPNLNPQALVEETVEPAIWKRGIIRICSSENPGAGTEPERWVSIGYCDSKNVKCWLDTESVEGAIKDLGLQNKTISEAEDISKKLLETGGFISRDDAETSLSEIEKKKPIVLDELKDLISAAKEKGISETKLREGIQTVTANITRDLYKLIESSLAEDIRARAQMQIGTIYNHIAILLKPKEKAAAGAEGKEELKTEEKGAEEAKKEETAKAEEKPQSQLELASTAYQAFALLVDSVMKSKESKCYLKINLAKDNLDDYRIRIKHSLLKGKELCLDVSLFKEKKILAVFSKEELIKESLVCTNKENITYVDTGYFIPGPAIQTAGMVLQINKDGELVAMPDVSGAKEIGNPVLFKQESKITIYGPSRQAIVGFMPEGTKEITKECS